MTLGQLGQLGHIGRLRHIRAVLSRVRVVRVVRVVGCLLLPLSAASASPTDTLVYEASATAVGSTATFAPYYLSALTHGRVSQGQSAQTEASLVKPMSLNKRWDWGAGIDGVVGAANGTFYERWEAPDWTRHKVSPPNAWIQQLYGQVKWRCLYLSAGLKEHESPLLDQRLTSGDLIESGNTRPVLQGRIGMVDYQPIPFTRGWVQIDVQLAYGKLLDNGWWRRHYNYYSGHINHGALYHYKRVYFRTKPEAPLSVTIGVQSAAQFGGTTDFYYRGQLQRTLKAKTNLRAFWDVLIPNHSGSDGYYEGNTLGSWDFKARYRLRSGHEIAAYFQWPWEDGSGMGKLNGFDGLWGLEWHAPAKGVVSGAVVEYLDFRNQSGPLHFAPGDFPGTTVTSEATGDDDYYNNAFYNAYAYYGLGMGTPFMLAPLYNRDGQLTFLYNRTYGFHIGLTGNIGPRVEYIVKGGWQRAWGAGRTPSLKARECTSAMLDVLYRTPWMEGLVLRGRVAFDAGRLRPNNFGAILSVTYTGLLTR